MIHKNEADKTNWDEDLPYFLFAYRETPRVIGFSPFELFKYVIRNGYRNIEHLRVSQLSHRTTKYAE